MTAEVVQLLRDCRLHLLATRCLFGVLPESMRADHLGDEAVELEKRILAVLPKEEDGLV